MFSLVVEAALIGSVSLLTERALRDSWTMGMSVG